MWDAAPRGMLPEILFPCCRTRVAGAGPSIGLLVPSACIALVALSCVLSGCGSDGDMEGAGGGSTTGGTSSGGNAAGGTGTGGSNDSGAGGTQTTPTPDCPAEAPSEGEGCPAAGMFCAYEDCDNEGRTVATCQDGTWSAETDACAETVYCSQGYQECAVGQVCMVSAGGALLVECADHTCGNGPIECDCITGCFQDCPLSGDPVSGITQTCNTCPSGQCALRPGNGAPAEP